MGFEQEIDDAIRNRWVTLVEEGLSVPTKYPNVDGLETTEGLQVWADISLDEFDATQIEPGSDGTLDRHIGAFSVNLYFKRGGTTQSPRILVDQIKPLFRKLTVTTPGGFGITFEVPRVTTIGDHEAWFVINILCPYTADEVT